MQHIKCKNCKTAISKTQRDSHNNCCGACYTGKKINKSIIISIKNKFRELRKKGKKENDENEKSSN